MSNLLMEAVGLEQIQETVGDMSKEATAPMRKV